MQAGHGDIIVLVYMVNVHVNQDEVGDHHIGAVKTEVTESRVTQATVRGGTD